VRSRFIFDVVHLTIFPIKRISILVNILVFHRELFISGFCSLFFQSRPKGEGRGRVSHLGTGDVAVQLKRRAGRRTTEVKLILALSLWCTLPHHHLPRTQTPVGNGWGLAIHSASYLAVSQRAQATPVVELTNSRWVGSEGMRTSGWNYSLLFHILAIFFKKNPMCTFERPYSEFRHQGRRHDIWRRGWTSRCQRIWLRPLRAVRLQRGPYVA